jgi:Amt family ammonium transporter
MMFVINLIPGCHFRATEEAEIVGMDEVELGEYVVDYAYHDRDLEGNCPFPPRQFYPSGRENEKAQNPASNSDDLSRKDETTLNRQASPRHDIEGSHTGAQEVYPGSRGEGRMVYPNGDEQVTAKHG